MLTRCDALNQKILQRVIGEERYSCPTRRFMASFALRACVVNHRTTPDDIEQVVSEVIAVGEN